MAIWVHSCLCEQILGHLGLTGRGPSARMALLWVISFPNLSFHSKGGISFPREIKEFKDFTYLCLHYPTGQSKSHDKTQSQNLKALTVTQQVGHWTQERKNLWLFAICHYGFLSSTTIMSSTQQTRQSIKSCHTSDRLGGSKSKGGHQGRGNCTSQGSIGNLGLFVC